MDFFIIIILKYHINLKLISLRNTKDYIHKILDLKN
jgi:hypothetical protein